MKLNIGLLIITALHSSCHGMCTSSNRTTYLRTDGHYVMNDGSKALRLSLSKCAESCTRNTNGTPCHSFTHDRSSNLCTLGEVKVQPFGTAVIGPAPTPHIAFYQKICINSTRLCEAEYSFERRPLSALIGMAREVLIADNLSHCLAECLESIGKYGFECRSSMYIYDTSECLLNAHHRHSRPDLLTNDTKGFIIDYFDNYCAGVDCFNATTAHYVKTVNVQVKTGDAVQVANVRLQKCREYCNTNHITAAHRIACKTFVYDNVGQVCQLYDERTRPRGAADTKSLVGMDLYEKVCLADVWTCNSSSSFVRISGHVLVGHVEEVHDSADIAHCLQVCLQLKCKSVMYNYDLQQCILNTATRFTHPAFFSSNTKGFSVDYFDNVCQYKDGSGGLLLNNDGQRTIVRDVGGGGRKAKKHKGAISTECRFDGVSVNIRFSRKTSGRMFVRNHHSTCGVEYKDAYSAELVIPLTPATNARNMPPQQTEECRGETLARGIYSYTIIIQRSNMGVPGLISSNDRLFNISCDYAHALSLGDGQVIDGRNVRGHPDYEEYTDDDAMATFDADSTEGGGGGGQGSEETPSEPVTGMPRVIMSIRRDGEQVRQVLLGETLQLRWVIVPTVGGDNVDFFIRNCTAERVGGNPPQPTPVRLISDGCPDASVVGRLINRPIRRTADGFATEITTFRFDGSKSVRVRCTVDLCVETCAAAVCAIDGEEVASHGRKRRSYLDANYANDTLGQDYEEERTSWYRHRSMDYYSDVFTVVSRLRSLDVVNVRDPFESAVDGDWSSYLPSMQPSSGRVCLLWHSFMVIALIVVTVCLFESAVILSFFYYRCSKHEHDSSSPSSSETGVYDRVHSRMSRGERERSVNVVYATKSTTIRGKTWSTASSTLRSRPSTTTAEHYYATSTLKPRSINSSAQSSTVGGRRSLLIAGF